MSFSVEESLLALFQNEGDAYRLIYHKPLERLDLLSRVCGYKLAQTTRVNLIMAKTAPQMHKYYLAVVPGDCQLNLTALQNLDQSLYLMFAPAPVVQELTGCHKNLIPPFSLHPDLDLVVDPALLENDDILFSAGRSDRSIAMQCDAYLRAARPRIARIATNLFR